MKLNYRALSTKNLRTLVQRILSISLSEKYTAINSNPLLQLLTTEAANYEAVEGKLTFSGKGKEVKEADDTRDLAFVGFKTLVEGYAALAHLGQYASAEQLYALIKQYGTNMNALTYSEQTAQMNKLIRDLDTEDKQQVITALALGVSYAHLKKSQTDFEAIFEVQTQANAELRQLSSASLQRVELEDALRNYLNMATAMRNVSDWKSLYTELNELVKAAFNSTKTTAKPNPEA